MAARGGRGGRGRGGAGSVFTPQLLGHLAYGDIIAQSKEGTGVFYPKTEIPQTEPPDEEEARIAKDQNDWSAEMKFTPYWIGPPTQASTEIEKYADRFLVTKGSADPVSRLKALNAKRKYNGDILPSIVYEALFGAKGKAIKGTGKNKIGVDDIVGEGDDEKGEEKAGEGSDSEKEEEPEVDEEEEENESEDNDYDDNYFDDGADDGPDGGDALGGGGDEGGGVYDN